MLEGLHEGHMGIELCNRRAPEIIFWPGITSQIEDKLSKCTVCQKKNAKESRPENI